MSRVRRRKSRKPTVEAAWLREREDCLRYWPGERLAECERFGEREPDVPDDLRTGMNRYRALIASDVPRQEWSDAMRRRQAERWAQWDDLKACRMAWLGANSYR